MKLGFLCACAITALFIPVGIAQSQNTDTQKDAKEGAAKLQPGTYYWADGVWRSRAFAFLRSKRADSYLRKRQSNPPPCSQVALPD